MRPSVIVRVDELEGSQLPLLVTTVTFHWPSNGLPANAGAAEAMLKRLAQASGANEDAAHESFRNLGNARFVGEHATKPCCDAAIAKTYQQCKRL